MAFMKNGSRGLPFFINAMVVFSYPPCIPMDAIAVAWIGFLA
jgi:hypothetical protein